MTSSRVMRFRLIPKEEKFFTDFITLADRIVSAATLLERMLASDPPAWETALQIRQIEHECDGIAHEIIQRLNRTFVTPIDREDIHALATSLDDVMDAIDEAAAVVRLFRIASIRYGARELASLIFQSSMQVRAAVEALEKRNAISVMKWKEMLDILEDGTDRCEDVANVLEGIVVKHG